MEILDFEVATSHEINRDIKNASAEKGEDIVKYGFTKNNMGGRTSRVSKHFV